MYTSKGNSPRVQNVANVAFYFVEVGLQHGTRPTSTKLKAAWPALIFFGLALWRFCSVLLLPASYLIGPGGHAMKRVALATDRIGRKTVCTLQYLGTSSYVPHSFSTMLSAALFS